MKIILRAKRIYLAISIPTEIKINLTVFKYQSINTNSEFSQFKTITFDIKQKTVKIFILYLERYINHRPLNISSSNYVLHRFDEFWCLIWWWFHQNNKPHGIHKGLRAGKITGNNIYYKWLVLQIWTIGQTYLDTQCIIRKIKVTNVGRKDCIQISLKINCFCTNRYGLTAISVFNFKIKAFIIIHLQLDSVNLRYKKISIWFLYFYFRRCSGIWAINYIKLKIAHHLPYFFSISKFLAFYRKNK